MTIWQKLFSIGVLCMLAGCASPPISAQSVPLYQEDSVRVMSYNIRCGFCEKESDVNHWSRRKFLVAKVIKASGADLIGLQEAELFQVQDLERLLGDYVWVGVGRDDGKQRGEMNAVLVRRSAYTVISSHTLWLSETPLQVSKGWDAMFNRTVTLLHLKDQRTGKPLNFLNTHFDHQGERARLESARLIAQTVLSLKPGEPVVLTGDFNARADFEGYKIITRQLQDAAMVSRTPAEGGSITFNGFGRDLQPDNKIDFIFVSPGATVLSHRVVTDLYEGLYPSDHYPVTATLRVH